MKYFFQIGKHELILFLKKLLSSTGQINIVRHTTRSGLVTSFRGSVLSSTAKSLSGNSNRLVSICLLWHEIREPGPTAHDAITRHVMKFVESVKGVFQARPGIFTRP